MSQYTKSTNFATKDNLTPGDPLKIVRGTEIDTEYNNIATAIATKTDNASAAITGGTINATTIGATTASTGAFSTLSATGAITSTLATGTAPLVIASTTKVANLNVDSLDGADWASPAALGSTTPAAVSATTLTTSSTVTFNGGTANGVAYLNGSKVVTSGSALTFDGTNLGIGTSSPSSTLQVGGGSGLKQAVVSGGGYDLILGASGGGIFGYSSQAISTVFNTASVPLGIGTNASQPLIFGTSATERMRLDSSGNLGIGSAPGATSGRSIDVNGVTLQPLITLRATTQTSATTTWTLDNGNTLVSFDSSADWPFRWTVNGSEQMRLTSTGLGIGTSSPSYKLDVNGQARLGGSTGLVFGVGTAFAGGQAEIYSTSTTPMGLGTTGAAVLRLYTNSTLQATLDSSGNLGLGVTPSAWSLGKAIEVNNTGNALWGVAASEIDVSQNAYYNAGWKYAASSYASRYEQNTGVHKWWNAPSGTAGNAISFSQAMTLDSSGNLLVGTTSTPNGGSNFYVAGGGTILNTQTNVTTSTNHIVFRNGNGNVGSISTSGSTTTFSTSSDYRLKDNIQDADSASTLIDGLKVRQFDWKADGSHQRYGFVAQELVTVAPEAVHQPEDTNEMMAVDYSKLVPMLVKEVQSLRKRLADAGL